ncbi:hypothetical protein NQ317_008439 [Molorchus minor]|uniref:Uncharacterized protein n=1 Tax=Molorchus minor TaxID=1323400 RepID=A0ABQ9JD34_9CUCU|nr:hypothetical protein NQ317_008439 [Molorchus minor]
MKKFCMDTNLIPHKMQTLQMYRRFICFATCTNELRNIHFDYLYDGLYDVMPISDNYSDNDELVKAVLFSGVGTVLNHRELGPGGMVTGLLTGHCHLSRHPSANWDRRRPRMPMVSGGRGDFISRPHRMPSNCKGQRTALWEQCSEPRRCQEDSAQEAMQLCQRGGHTWLRHSKECGCTMGPLGGLRARDSLLPTIEKEYYSENIASENQVKLCIENMNIQLLCDKADKYERPYISLRGIKFRIQR